MASGWMGHQMRFVALATSVATSCARNNTQSAVNRLALPFDQAQLVPVNQQPSPNRNRDNAMQWLHANLQQFGLTLRRPNHSICFAMSPNQSSVDPNVGVFRISHDEATSIMNVMVDSGMLGRDDFATLPIGAIPITGRWLFIRPNGDPVGSGAWSLGADSDDVTSMFIIRHLLDASDSRRRAAIENWLIPVP